jgi:Uma2 family endonuclease
MAAEALEPIPLEPEFELETLFRRICDMWEKTRVEIVDGRIVVNPVPTGEHNDIVFQLLRQLISVVHERGWKIWTDITLYMGPQKGRFRPDLTVVPREPRMWGKDHIHADDALLVVEVVSVSSVIHDHEVKPQCYAEAGVPLCLVIDTFTRKVRLHSQPGEEGYEREVDVAFGRPIDLPEPWGLTLDTAALTS